MKCGRGQEEQGLYTGAARDAAAIEAYITTCHRRVGHLQSCGILRRRRRHKSGNSLSRWDVLSSGGMDAVHIAFCV